MGNELAQLPQCEDNRQTNADRKPSLELIGPRRYNLSPRSVPKSLALPEQYVYI